MSRSDPVPEESIGPRREGGVYRNENYEYEVLHVGRGQESRVWWSPWSITIRRPAHSGHGRQGATEVATHCTPWDRRRDVVVRQP